MVRPGLRDLFWMAGGMVLLTVITLLAVRGYREEDTAAKTAFKARRIELVTRIRAALSAASGYARFDGVKKQIFDLSRQNTNVRSLTISLNDKRMAVKTCQDILGAIEQAIREEPLTSKPPVVPR
jgi:hypothetical protein